MTLEQSTSLAKKERQALQEIAEMMNHITFSGGRGDIASPPTDHLSEANPCAICGSTKLGFNLHPGHGGSFTSVRCRNCGCSSWADYNEELAVAEWNEMTARVM